jgi:hypothetical protein
MNLETHLNELAAPEAAGFRDVAGRLRAVPQREPSAALTGRILAAVQADRARRRRLCPAPRALWRGAAALAASLVAVATVFLCQSRLGGGRSAEGSVGWLAAHQEADGTWNPARHGGDPSYRPALTALAALALSRDPARHAERIGRACDALAALQTADGAFGGSGRAEYYNQAMATYALAALIPQQPRARPALERAMGFSLSRQSAEGGWDYEPGSEGNAAVTAWQVRALSCAAGQGVARADVPLRKGLRWLRGAARADGSVAYHRDSGARSECLTALAAYALMTSGKPFPGLPALGRHMAASLASGEGQGADCYRDAVKVLAFESAGAGGEAETVRGGMLRRWRSGAQDQWEKVGGALYTRAFTVLAAK